jgi:hypothetical protein
VNLGTNTITIQRQQIDQNFNGASTASKVVTGSAGTAMMLLGLGMIGLGGVALREEACERKNAPAAPVGPA